MLSLHLPIRIKTVIGRKRIETPAGSPLPLHSLFSLSSLFSVSHIISLASAASPEEYVSDDLVERLMCGDEFTLTVENDGSIPADAAEQGTAKAGFAPLILKN